MSSILFGSLSTVADTSELQRAAFNAAFSAHGLDWSWDRDEYRELLTGNGGQRRIADYAAGRGEDVDAKAVHESKSKIFQESLATAELSPRPGVVDTIAAARAAGWQVAFVTTTSRANIASLLERLADTLPTDAFDLVVDSSSVDAPKPDPAAYTFALQQLGEQAADCVAVEDNVGGVRAAEAAGVRCIAFPNENTVGHDFGDARVVDRLSFTDLS